MKKIFLFIATIFSITVNAQNVEVTVQDTTVNGQSATTTVQQAKQVFLSMPDSITPLLTSVNKADMIDFIESEMKAQVKNKFGNNSEMTDLTSDFIRIQMTEKSSWQLKIISMNDSTRILGIATTACAPVCDTKLHFYTTNWEPLSVSSVLEVPMMNDFFQEPDSTQMHQYTKLRSKAEMFLMKADFSPDLSEIKFTLTTPENMEPGDAKKISPYIRPIFYSFRNL